LDRPRSVRPSTRPHHKQASYVWDTQSEDGTLTYHTETYDTSSGTLSLGPTIAGVAPVPSTDGPNGGFLIPNSNSSLFVVTAEHLDPTFPSLNAFSTRYDILDSNGHVLVSTSGPAYTSGTQYAFTAGAWNPSQFVEFVAIFQGEVKPFFIDATTGNEVPASWSVMTNLSKITSLSYTGLTSPEIILLAGGTASDGSGAASQSLVDASSSATAGTVLKQSILHYSGTVVQNARLSSLGNDNFLFYWVDQSGLHLQEEDSNFNVLENFDIAETNGAATASSYGDGRILVVYNVASPDKSTSTQKYTILDTRTAAINGTGVAVNGNLAGTAFDDTIAHSTAATNIDGAGGTDTYAMTQFSSSQISITRNPSGYPAGSVSVTSPDGTDVLSNVEFLQLADTRILLVPPPSSDPLFDSAYYESRNPDVAAAGVDPLAHYNQYGWHEGRNPDVKVFCEPLLVGRCRVQMHAFPIYR
jgi:hypothetical protein